MTTQEMRWAGMRGFGHPREGSEPLVHSQPACVSWIAQIGDHPVSFLFFMFETFTVGDLGESCTRLNF
jgi:hypothetical protein